MLLNLLIYQYHQGFQFHFGLNLKILLLMDLADYQLLMKCFLSIHLLRLGKSYFQMFLFHLMNENH